MATIKGNVTCDDVLYLSVDSDPSAGAGTKAPIGSHAQLTDGNGEYYKFGAGDTQWIKLQQGVQGSQGNQGQGTQGNQGTQGTIGTGGVTGYYGEFYDSTTQTFPTANTVFAITFNNTQIANGTSIGSPTSRIVIANGGTYVFTYTLQIGKVATGTAETLTIWFRKNGIDIPASSNDYTIQSNNTKIFSSTGMIDNCNSGDYYELVVSADNTDLQILSLPARITPTRPLTPSAILNISQVTYAGVQGNQGTQGRQGVQGVQGLNGAQGFQGSQGFQGNQGFQSGVQGFQGTQGNQGLQGTQGVQGLQGTQGFQGGITSQEVSATADDTITSTTYVVINSMTVTPASGTYIVMFSSSANASATGADINYAIHKAAVIVAQSERNLDFNGGAATNGFDTALHTQAIVTVDGTQAIDVRGKTSTGNFVVHERNIILIKV